MEELIIGIEVIGIGEQEEVQPRFGFGCGNVCGDQFGFDCGDYCVEN